MKNIVNEIVTKLPAMRNDPRFSGFFTISTVADAFSAGYRTAARAVSRLKERDVLTAVHGKGVYFKNASPGPGRPGNVSRTTAVNRLADLIDDRICRGIYRIDIPLPKSAFLAATENTTSLTIAAAMRNLARRGRVYKRGNRWYPGPRPPSPRDAAIIRSGPTDRVVLIHLPGSMNQWYRMADKIHITPFYLSFCSVLQKYGVQYRTVLQEHRTNERPFVCGQRNIARYIASLGSRYAGTLLHLGIDPDKVYEWITFYGRYREPVALLTAGPRSKPAVFSRRTVTCAAPFFHLVRDENAPVIQGIQALIDAGHRHLGIVRQDTVNFDSGRFSLICTWLREHHPDIKVSWRFLSEYQELLSRRNPDFPAESRWRGPQNFIDHLATSFPDEVSYGRVRSQSLRKKLRSTVPSLAELVDLGPTALVAWNDSVALGVYYWLIYAGYTVPGDMSLISFDNELAVSTSPLTTVDFGLEELGYLGAHIFIRDIPVKADDRWGTITGKPIVMDRGSLGPPHIRQKSVKRATRGISA